MNGCAGIMKVKLSVRNTLVCIHPPASECFIIITSSFTHFIYNKVVKLISLISLTNTQIIDDEFYIININFF